jgi:aspartyl aminopeptidase
MANETVEALKKELLSDSRNGLLKIDGGEAEKASAYCENYVAFMNACRTERECASFIIDSAKKNGYAEFDRSAKYSCGDKIYFNNRGKSVVLCTFGRKPLSEGARIVASHIDSPRLDLKPNPLYEDSELAYFKTHYYGGIKKYQWTVTPLSLHGVIIKKNGESVTVSIGDKPGEPKFVITDLLPHLDKNQGKRTLDEGVTGEELNILIGSCPLKDGEGDNLVKLNIMKILNEKYGIVEDDFKTAELEAVPAYPACDIGFDSSLIGAYGHDDRVCAYPAFTSQIDAGTPEYTSIAVLTDKEETGSDGVTGLNSAYLKHFIYDIAESQGFCGRDVIRRCECLSADVNAALDPIYADAHEKNNAAFLNKGIVLTKYTGHRGKGDTSDANAEFTGKVARIFDGASVVWQTGELGKVDMGGGGTVAKYLADTGIEVIDVGVPLLSMHAPFEIASKLDIYMAYKGFKAFYEAE